MQEKTAVHCNTLDEAVNFIKWAESENLCRKGGYEANGWENGWKDTRAYDLHLGRCIDIHHLNNQEYSVLKYEDVLILREKEVGDRIVHIQYNKLISRTIDSIGNFGDYTNCIVSSGNNKGIVIVPKENLWFDSPNIELKLTKNGIKVTGEVEPERKYFCPICNGKLNMHHDGTVDKFKELGVHQCLHHTVVSVVGSTIEEVHDNLNKFYKGIKNEEGSN